MKNATKRRAASKNLLDSIGLDFEFFDAIDGNNISNIELLSAYDELKNIKYYKHPLSLPEIGCYLSHYSLWKHIVETKLHGAIILEDDFYADESLKIAVEKIRSTHIPSALVKFFSRKPVRGVTVTSFSNQLRIVSPNRVPGLTLGYSLDRIAAEMLIVNALPFWRPLDMDLKHWWEFSVPILVFDPPPLRIGELGFCSSISPARDKSGAQSKYGKIGRFLANISYQVDYNIRLIQGYGKNRQAVRRLREQLLESIVKV